MAKARLLDLLEAHEDWSLIDGDEVWPVGEWAAEWIAAAGPPDRGPSVTTWGQDDGRHAVVALDEGGAPIELVGVLATPGSATAAAGASDHGPRHTSGSAPVPGAGRSRACRRCRT